MDNVLTWQAICGQCVDLAGNIWIMCGLRSRGVDIVRTWLSEHKSLLFPAVSTLLSSRTMAVSILNVLWLAHRIPTSCGLHAIDLIKTAS